MTSAPHQPSRLPTSRPADDRARSGRCVVFSLCSLVCLTGSTIALAEDGSPSHWNRWLARCTQGEDRSLAGRHARAGCPRAILPWAGPAYEKFDCGYYVGGGAPWYGPVGKLHGERRCPDEGVWGIDYAFPTTRVRLQWYHGGRTQGGGGQYEPNARNNPLTDLFHP